RDSEWYRYRASWEKLKKEFECRIINLDVIDWYPTGMDISLLLNSSYTFEEQREFVRKHKKRIYKYLCENLPTMNGTVYSNKPTREKASAFLPYCILDNIVLTRGNILIYKFELKPDIVEILKSTEDEKGGNGK
ncbi:MAG: hypothetical protein K2F99_09620, partial [Muribaculaceae bacterium]|nr:hypothetical protein [Muribaculaceae bacterium]